MHTRRHIHHTKLVTAMSCFTARGHDKNQVCSHFQNSLMSITVVEKYWLKAQISAVESMSRSDLVLSEVTWGGINKYNNVHVVSKDMDGRMTCGFISFSTVFQSYQDDGWMIMEGCVQWSLVYGWEDFASSRAQTWNARSVGQQVLGLTQWATWAPSFKGLGLIKN